MVVDGRMTAVRFIAFLKRLLHNQTQPIFLIVDQHSSHRAKAVQEFVASTDGHLELFFLPPYSPELNPDELVWNHLKTHGVRKRLLQTPQELKRYVLGHMRSLQRTPALLRGFFKKPSLRYINLEISILTSQYAEIWGNQAGNYLYPVRQPMTLLISPHSVTILMRSLMSMLPARGDAVVQERPAVRELAAASRCNTRRDRHHQVPGVGLVCEGIGVDPRVDARGVRCCV